mgnify:CR=1 FL=1|jgi:uncharacterized protein YqeY
MSIKETLQEQLKAALKSGDNERKLVLRSLQAAIRQVEIDSQVTLDDSGVLKVVQKEMKSLQESLTDAQKAERADLMAQCNSRIAILQIFLPTKLTEAEIIAIANVAIAKVQATNPSLPAAKQTGLVMKEILAQVDNRADGKMVNQIVTQLLQAQG